MALASRNARRGGAGFRWLAVGVALTLLILLIDASLKSRSPTPRQQLAAGEWVDRVLPVIASSTAQGREIAGIWAGGLKTPAPTLVSSINSVAAGAAKNYRTVVGLQPPNSLLGPAGLLEAALLARSQAATSLQKVLVATLGSAANAAPATTPTTPASSTSSTTSATTGSGAATTTTSTTVAPVGVPPATVVPDVTRAGAEIQVGDSAYSLFLGSIPASVGVRMPASAWAGDMAPYTAQAAQVFLASLQTAVVTTPVHQVKIYAISLNPSPVSTSGSTQVLPDATAVTVTIVLADTGNQPENNLTVTASISPAASGASSARDFVNLAVGQAYTISGLGPLNPPQGPPVTLTVTVTPPAGSPTPPVTSTVTFSMPAPAPPTTTTTTVPAAKG